MCSRFLCARVMLKVRTRKGSYFFLKKIKELFEKMLKIHNLDPSKLAYDRPSAKLLGFLKKHYSLSSYVPQNNNYVIFYEYFSNN
jgi:hypothetical protein